MILRQGSLTFRRFISTTTPRQASTQKLPFEKPVFESPLLDKARSKLDFTKRLEFYFDVISIAVTATVVARVGYYLVYGKESGAAALPSRYDSENFIFNRKSSSTDEE